MTTCLHVVYNIPTWDRSSRKGDGKNLPTDTKSYIIITIIIINYCMRVPTTYLIIIILCCNLVPNLVVVAYYVIIIISYNCPSAEAAEEGRAYKPTPRTPCHAESRTQRIGFNKRLQVVYKCMRAWARVFCKFFLRPGNRFDYIMHVVATAFAPPGHAARARLLQSLNF